MREGESVREREKGRGGGNEGGIKKGRDCEEEQEMGGERGKVRVSKWRKREREKINSA